MICLLMWHKYVGVAYNWALKVSACMRYYVTDNCDYDIDIDDDGDLFISS